MAEMYDPVAGLIDPQTYDKIASQWTSFLDQPTGRAALLQTGIALNQPLAWGQSNFGALTGALGAGGEALGRVEAMDLKQREVASREEARAAAANLAEARAATAGQAGQLQQSRLEQAKTLAQLKASYQLRQMHSAYENKQRALNEKVEGDILNPPVGKPGHRSGTPILPFEQWLQTDPAAKELAVRSGFSLSGGGGGGSGGAPQTRALSPTPVPVNSPEEALGLPSGQTIVLPDGRTGTVP